MSKIKLKMMGHGCVLSLHLSVCVSITVSAHSSIPCDLLVYSYICQPVGLFFCFSRSSIHLSIHPSTYPSFNTFVCTPVCLSFVCLYVLFVCLSCLFVCLVCLSVLFVCLSCMSCLFVRRSSSCLAVHPFIYPLIFPSTDLFLHPSLHPIVSKFWNPGTRTY